MHPTDRPRRLRTDGARSLVSETSLSASDLVAPVFVDATTDERVPIETMPGHERVPVDEAVARVEEVRETGVEAVIVFGIPESKDAEGTRAYAEDGVVQRAIRRITAETDAYVIGDVCLCEYTRPRPLRRDRGVGGDGPDAHGEKRRDAGVARGDRRLAGGCGR